MRADTDWFFNAKWGLFIHYLADVAGNKQSITLTPEAWNKQIDAFDVHGLARQVVEFGAGYLFLTLGQNSGFFLSPNETYDRLVGRSSAESRMSKRDIVAELAAALKPHGIRMMVYLPSLAPANDRHVMEALDCTPPWNPELVGFTPGSYIAKPGVDARLSSFQRKWEAIIGEWSLRWGDTVHGWWFDGCYTIDKLYNHADEPNFRSFAAAAKAGNSNSLVAFNPGVFADIRSVTEYEDYTAGELDNALPVLMQEVPWRRSCFGRYVDGAQLHMLSFLGMMWGQCGPNGPRFSDELAIGYTKDFNRWGGVVSWDVPTTKTGLIDERMHSQLRKLGKAMKES